MPPRGEMTIPQLTDTTTPGPDRRNRRPAQPARAYVGIPEAAVYLDVATKTIRRYITDGTLPAYRLGNRVIKVKIADLESVLTPIGGAV
jgi:excisionase family DNA binding protein